MGSSGSSPSSTLVSASRGAAVSARTRREGAKTIMRRAATEAPTISPTTNCTTSAIDTGWHHGRCTSREQRARVVEWQTRRTQNPLLARACGFESHLGHPSAGPGHSARTDQRGGQSWARGGRIAGCLLRGLRQPDLGQLSAGNVDEGQRVRGLPCASAAVSIRGDDVALSGRRAAPMTAVAEAQRAGFAVECVHPVRR